MSFVNLFIMNIKTSYFAIFVLLLYGILFSSCSSASKSTPEVLSGSVLWEVSGNGLDKSSYILGSFHVETEEALQDIQGLNPAFEASTQVVGEIDMASYMQNIAALQEAMMMPDGISYKELLSEEDYAFLDNKLKTSVGAGLDQFGAFNPAALYNIYSLTLVNKIMGKNILNPSEGMDTYFQTKGREKGKSIIGLETAEHQIDVLFNSRTTEEQLADLLCAMKNDESTEADILKLIKSYKEGNLLAMNEMIKDDANNPCPTNKNFENALLHDRNNNWMKIIPELMQSQSNFIVVGALHLVGDTGLLKQLVDKGYTVTPVK